MLPALAIAGSPVKAAPLAVGIATAIALAAFSAGTWAGRGRLLALVGVLGAGAAAWLLAQASYPAAAWLIAPALGFGAGLAGGSPASGEDVGVSGTRSASPAHVYAGEYERGRRRVRREAKAGGRDRWPVLAGMVGALAVAAGLVALRAAFGRDAALAVGAAYVALAALLRLPSPAPGRWPAAGVAALAVGGLLLPTATAAYVGATTPRATWFGALTSHGPRSSNQVALTFDDGPDPPFSLQIAQILDQYSAKGTFFTVGKALAQRPDVSRALLADGQLLGNHSYTHDAVRWLDPRYRELKQTQDAFRRNLGVCPAFYRPPHGSHTPFMARVVADNGMTMVTWDDSAGDWATNDAQLVARRILAGVKPGSIILLHDGIDGKIGADRTVVLQALPIILDGLKARGLQPVTLDKLLGKPGYLPC